ncbi:galactose mutarotase [Epibacterium sp. DP7N7-1]|nr:galactose mutarotase [Epibacterium sp. DP7N7-1]
MSNAQILDHGLHQGHMLKEVRMHSTGLSVSLLNFGAVTRDLRLLQGNRPLILGFEDPAAYLSNPGYLGVIAGRVAGRIKNARFALDGQSHQLDANEGDTLLHGGAQGLSHAFWEIELLSDASARLRYHSPEGEAGFPGAVDVSLTVTLDGLAIVYDMRAAVSAPTPISLAQHNYYNLTGGGQTVRDHRLQVDASSFLVLDDANVPTGKIAALDGSHHDFRLGRSFSDVDPQHRGSDVALVFDTCRDPELPVATLTAPDGLQMRIVSDQPCAQIYTATTLPEQPGALPRQRIGPAMGVCIEPQGFPNAVNLPQFPSVIATPDHPYRQHLRLEFGWI